MGRRGLGQDAVSKLLTPDSTSAVPLPEAISNKLSFRLGLNAPIRWRLLVNRFGLYELFYVRKQADLLQELS